MLPNNSDVIEFLSRGPFGDLTDAKNERSAILYDFDSSATLSPEINALKLAFDEGKNIYVNFKITPSNKELNEMREGYKQYLDSERPPTKEEIEIHIK